MNYKFIAKLLQINEEKNKNNLIIFINLEKNKFFEFFLL